jgi:hypothetical protein
MDADPRGFTEPGQAVAEGCGQCMGVVHRKALAVDGEQDIDDVVRHLEGMVVVVFLPEHGCRLEVSG